MFALELSTRLKEKEKKTNRWEAGIQWQRDETDWLRRQKNNI